MSPNEIPVSGRYTATAPVTSPVYEATYPQLPPCTSTTNTRFREAEADCLIASQ